MRYSANGFVFHTRNSTIILDGIFDLIPFLNSPVESQELHSSTRPDLSLARVDDEQLHSSSTSSNKPSAPTYLSFSYQQEVIMLLNHILFWMMISEAVICLIISLPFGKKISLRVIQFFVAQFGGKDSWASFIAMVILALVAILFVSDVHTCYRHHTAEGTLTDGLRIRLLAAQRDMYISGFVLFLFLLLRMLYTSIATNIHLEKSLVAMKKQAEGAAAGFKQQLEENESIKKQLAKVHLLLGNDDNDDDEKDESKKKANILAKLVEENAYLTTKLETAKHDLKHAENKVEIVKKQAESQSSAFMKLMDEKSEADKHVQQSKEQQKTIEQQTKEIKELKSECESLKAQIQDYDFMFAEAKKKAE